MNVVKKTAIAVVALAPLFASTLPSAADSLTLINETGSAIVAVYARDAGSPGGWGRDLLGNGGLTMGEETTVRSHNLGGCEYDFKVVYEDGTDRQISGVTTCEGIVVEDFGYMDVNDL